ncbi:MAG TPA: fibronectin type III domain-containing protein [Pedobacter sp.]
MKNIARRRFITNTVKMGALLPVLAVPSVLLPETKKEYAPDIVPDRVILTVTADPSSSVTVNWRTVNVPEESVVEYTVADAHPEFISKVTRLKADSKVFRFEDITAVNHRVTLKDLQPDTLYIYRAGQENGWSEWMQFRTAQRNLPSARISFIYLGDAQVGIRPLWSRVIRKAYAGMPDAQLIIHAGDLVNRANKDEEWGDWFAAGTYIHGSVPSLMTPGNHEYTHEDGKPHLSVYWK